MLTKPKPILLLAVFTLLGGITWAVKPLAFAQNGQPAIRLINIVKYYEGLPYQDRALGLLQNQIDNMNPELLQADSIVANVWRNADPLSGHVDILDSIPAANRTGADPLD